MKKILLWVTVLLMAISIIAVFSLTGCKEAAEEAVEEEAAEEAVEEEAAEVEESTEGFPAIFKDKQLEIAVLRNDASNDHCAMMLEGARVEGESLGFIVDTMITNNDDVVCQDMFAQIVQKGYDGIILSHGKQEYSYDMVMQAIDEGIPVVTFDTLPLNAEGKAPEGVTMTAQDDYSLASESLDAIIARSDKYGRVPNVVRTYLGPGIPPLDRRYEVFDEYEKDGKINVVGSCDVVDFGNDSLVKCGALLNTIPKGEIDAIWGSCDMFAQGAYIALKESDRMEIEVFTIDLSNTDLNYMREEESTFISATAVDASLIGEVCIKILASKLAGDETPPEYSFEVATVYQEDLKPDTNVTNLSDVIPGWGQSDAFEQPWMQELREFVASK